MDYKKKYEAVLRTAKQWIADGCSETAEIALEAVFPELRESEDERIRKEMIRHYQNVLKDGVDITTTEDTKRWLAYLEKQKEQKPADLPDGFYVTLNGKKYYTKEVRCKGMNVKVVEHKSAEWSEQEDNKIKSIKGLITTGKFADTNTIRTIWELLDSLRPQPKWKPSEEQLNELHGALIPGHGYDCDVLQGLYADLKKQMKEDWQ